MNENFKTMNEENSYKLIILGDTGVGKTSIISRRIYQRFDDNVPLTVGVSNFTITEKIKGKDIELKVWDTAGQEQYASLIPMFSRNSDVCILCCDVTTPNSFDHLEMWKTKLNDSGCDPPIILAINKMDLSSDNFEKIYEDHSKTLEKFDTILYVSAKINSGIADLFQLAAEKAYEYAQNNHKTHSKTVQDMNINNGPQDNKKCCQ